MEILTLADFDRYIKEKKLTLFIYDNKNNRNRQGRFNSQYEPVFLNLTFNCIKVYHNHPCIKKIDLIGKDSHMCISFVDKIKVIKNDSLLGDTVIIYTKMKNTTNKYTIIMR